jgi:CSLREA domain-containing protein
MFRSLLKLAKRRPIVTKVARAELFRPVCEELETRMAPAVLTVNTTVDGATSGSNVLSLRQAVGLVNGTVTLTSAMRSQVSGTLGSNDTIQFNLASGPQTIKLQGGLSLLKPVTINGPGTGNLTIDAANLSRVFIIGVDYSQNLNLRVGISGLTIADGNAVSAGYGGGILNFGTTTIANCSFGSNAAGGSGGGAIYNNGAMTVTGSTFVNNSVTNGGSGAGILNTTSATLTVTNCTFSAGVALKGGQGGGIANNGVLIVSASTFTGNTVNSNGAGIHNSKSGKLTVTNSTFTNGNCTSDGGGFDSDGAATVTYCTFSNNTVGGEGGAIDGHGTINVSNSTFIGNTAGTRGGAFNVTGTAQIVNCTITGNRAASGGGIYSTGGASVFNTIVAGDFTGTSSTANDIVGNVTSTSAANLIGVGGSGGLANGANGNLVAIANPGLSALSNNGGPTLTIAPMAGSPAIGHGNNAYVAAGATDQRGLPRIVNGTVDIGAVELQGTVIQQAASLTVAGFPASTAGAANSFTVTVRDASGNVVTGYTGTVHFTSSDSQASLPGDYTFVSGDNGVHTFAATLKTAGAQSLTATDTNTQALTGAESGIAVTAAAASTIAVAGFPSPATAGAAGTFTVTARDAYGNKATGYTGTLHFTSSDSQASLPANYSFGNGDAGTHTFSATFNSAGTQSLTASDIANPGLAATLAGIAVTATAPNATVLTVNSSADSTSTGNNILTLREAIGLVNGTLQLTAGEQSQVSGPLSAGNLVIQFSLPAGAQTITLTGGALSVTKAVSINGPGAGNLTVSGNNADRVFVVGNIYSQNLGLVVNMSGLTISGGSAVAGSNNYGGGLLNFGTLSVNNCTFAGNAAGNSGGGGIYNDGALTLSNDTFTGNTVTNAGSGGGILNVSSATLTATNCVFNANAANGSGALASQGAALANSGNATVNSSTFTANNATTDGGAVYNSSGATLTFTTCAFTNNTAGSDGGAIRNGGTLNLTYCLFNGNSTVSGGGAIDTSGALTATCSTFAGNTAVSRGGAIEEETGGSATLTNCTVTSNRVTVGDSGRFGGGLFAGSPVKLFNTIVAGNFQGASPGTTADDLYGTLDSFSAYNLIGTGGAGGLTDSVNGNQVGVSNPGLGTLADNGGPTLTVALLPGSPASDRGSNAYVTPGETDQRGVPRIVNGTVDIGAFEDPPLAATTLGVTGVISPTMAGGAVTITVTARDATGLAASTYAGKVHFTSSDAQAVLPSDYTFTATDHGVHIFYVTFKTAGAQSVTATDSANSAINGTLGAITVAPAAATTLVVAGYPLPTAVGTNGNFTVTAVDAFGNTATGYRGTLHFTSSDSQAVLPANTTLTAGVGNFTAAFNTAGTQTLTATDAATPTLRGTESGIVVSAAGSGPSLTVNSTADTTGPDSYLTLREAIALVNGTLGRSLSAGEQAQVNGPIGPNDVIQFKLPAGAQITLTSGPLNITQPVTITGPGAANLTISGGNGDRAFVIGQDYSQNLSQSVAISGLKVTGGKAITTGHNYGGGLLNFGTLTLTNVTFTGNVAGSSGGGAIFNDGALTLIGCTLDTNSVTAGGPGGGLENTTAGSATLFGCTVTNNTGSGGASGAGIANSGNLTLTNTWVGGNVADSDGGGVYNSVEGMVTMTGSTIVNNDAGSDGGGVHSDGTSSLTNTLIAFNYAASEGGGMDNQGTASLTNCTLFNNTAVSCGGGLKTSAPATLINCTITANEVTTGSSGIYGAGICDLGTAARLFNTIVAGNFHDPNTVADDIAGAVDLASAFNLIGTGGAGGLANNVNNNLVGIANPGVAGLADNGGITETCALLPGSPAIGHGNNAYVAAGATDARGFARVVNGSVDIGAFEVQ